MGSTTPTQAGARRRLLIVQEVLPSYRVEFFRQLGQRVPLTVLYGDADRFDGFDMPAQDQLPAGVEWLRAEPRRITIRGRSAVWFPGLMTRVAAIRPSDVITLGAKRFIQNHVLMVRQKALGYRLYFLQHARNYGARSRVSRLAERLYHRHYICRASAGLIVYTGAEKRELVANGFPPEKVSFTENAIDTRAIRRVANQLTTSERLQICGSFGIREAPSIAFIGRLVAGKRVTVAIEYHEALRARVPSLQTIIVGDGPERELVKQGGETRPGIIATGPVYDEKVLAALLQASRFVFCPGYAGLNVVHAFAHGRPFVTFRSSSHKPEFSYVLDGQNGLVLDEGQPQRNQARLEQLLLDDALWKRLTDGAADSASTLTIEGMVDRVCDTLARGRARR